MRRLSHQFQHVLGIVSAFLLLLGVESSCIAGQPSLAEKKANKKTKIVYGGLAGN
jgi:hypothetical protein